MTGRNLDLMLFGKCDNFISILNAHCYGLFYYNIDASCDSFNCSPCVKTTGKRNAYKLRLFRIIHLTKAFIASDIFVNLHLGTAEHIINMPVINITDADYFKAVFNCSLYVFRGNSATAHKSILHSTSP